MTQDAKARLYRYTAIPMAALICAGMYFGARALSMRQFDAAVASASETEVQIKDGLWNYNALSTREQKLYDVLFDAMEGRDTRTARVSFVPTPAEFSAAFDAVLYDHPQFCDLVREECTLLAASHSAQVSLSYLPDGTARRAALEHRARELLPSTDDTKDAALQLHDRLTARCGYPAGTDAAVGGTAYDALVVGEADGFGYALAYTYLCRLLAIPCAVVTGTADAGDHSGAHAWNVLTLDGETGFTDVMWNDTAAGTDSGWGSDGIPFHGYYFLSADEIGSDHTPIIDFGARGDTQNYYEREGLCADTEEALASLLPSLLTEARRRNAAYVEFCPDPALHLTGYALEELLSAAIQTANDDPSVDAPYLRQVNRVYHTSDNGGGITVQLFYEESEALGETQ